MVAFTFKSALFINACLCAILLVLAREAHASSIAARLRERPLDAFASSGGPRSVGGNDTFVQGERGEGQKREKLTEDFFKKRERPKKSYEELFETWRATLGLRRGDVSEDRLAVFAENSDRVAELMKQGVTTAGLNILAGLTESERKALLGFKPLPAETEAALRRTAEDRRELQGGSAPSLPASVDWRGSAVTNVKDQGQCGACWAFAATGLIEGAFARATGIVHSLSEQELLDCDTERDTGCVGGNFYWAIKDYVMHHGSASGQAYPWENPKASGTCRPNVPRTLTYPVGDVQFVQPNEVALMRAVARGPVAVALSAYSPTFQFYTSGVLTDVKGCGHESDHAALIVGYGRDEASGLDYWLLKNSWGVGWGERGYIRLKRGLSSSEMLLANNRGMCGILAQANVLTRDPVCAVPLGSNATGGCVSSRGFCVAGRSCNDSSTAFGGNGSDTNFVVPGSKFVTFRKPGVLQSPAFIVGLSLACVAVVAIAVLGVVRHYSNRRAKAELEALSVAGGPAAAAYAEQQRRRAEDIEATKNEILAQVRAAHGGELEQNRLAEATKVEQLRTVLAMPPESDPELLIVLRQCNGDVDRAVAFFVEHDHPTA